MAQPKVSTDQPKLVFTLLLLLLVFVVIGFGVGFIIGRLQANAGSNNPTGKSSSTTTAGKTTFVDPKDKYSIVFPENWKVTEKTTSVPGVIIERDKNSVELWIRVEQPLSLSQEQKDALSSTNKVKLKINGKEVEMTEYAYKTGGYFSTVILPATETTTIATFWIKAVDQESYNSAKEIVQSFKFS